MVTQSQLPMTPLERVNEPDMGTGVIDQTRYTSLEFAQLEWERMWTKVWNIAGPLCDIPRGGRLLHAHAGAGVLHLHAHG